MDIPQEQLRAIILPADPVPVWQPRVENFEADETDYRTVLPVPSDLITGLPMPAQTALRITQDCENRITQPIGVPNGLVQNAVMPFNGGIQKAFAIPLAVLSVIANGTATIQVTCSKPHGLKTDDQLSIEGLTAANGFHSVTVLTATAFTYMVADNVRAGSLLTSATVFLAGSSIPAGSDTPVGAGSSSGGNAPNVVTTLVGLPYGSKKIPPAYNRGPSFGVAVPAPSGGAFLAGSSIPAGSPIPAGSG